MMYLFQRIWPVAFALCLMGGSVAGETIPQPTGPVILTVTGLDTAEFPGGTFAFDLESLALLGVMQFATTSIWTDGSHVYTGLLLKNLTRALKIEGAVLRLHALNDYAVEFPEQAATDEAPILAYQMDGQPMSVRDKGPIWVIYPYDAGPEYRTDTTFSRSIWQLDRIDVLR